MAPLGIQFSRHYAEFKSLIISIFRRIVYDSEFVKTHAGDKNSFPEIIFIGLALVLHYPESLHPTNEMLNTHPNT